jgi:Tfp pilus tip-associated adhesin PilY1
MASVGGALLLTAVSAGLVYADNEQFTSDTMETRVTSPPPNIMILHDNSGSMDWEFVTPETDGQFNNNYYLWDLGTDDAYGSGSTVKASEWQARWAGYNSIFYHPDTTYAPWPRWNKTNSTEDSTGKTIKNGGIYPPFNADLKTPRPNPIYRYAPLDLTTQYTTFPEINAVIVDNADGSPTFTSDFSNSTANTPSWFSNAGYQRFGTAKTSVKTAKFTPNLTAGRYTVWAWWPCATDSDGSALITLNINGSISTERRSQQATTSNTVRTGYCGEWIPLFGKALYTLPVGNATSLSISRDGSSTNNSYTFADAVAFLPEGYSAPTSTVSVKNAHYYMVNDLNGDGKPQQGEVYLVNFAWTDSNSNGKVDEGEVLRQYYLVTYQVTMSGNPLAPNNHDQVLFLKKVSYNPAAPGSDAVPDAIQPKTYNDDGTVKDFVSDLNDLQNFANWFSFYQRRELTAKAAISRTLVKLDNVYMGYKTLWLDNATYGANQPVLPIKTYQAIDPSVIVDDQSTAGFTKGSAWTAINTRTPAWKTNSLYTSKKTSSSVYANTWALFTPTISEAGRYNVSAWWPCNTGYDKNAKITIVHKNGTGTAYYNQKASSNGVVTTGASCTDISATTGCCGYWIDLGDYYFNAGTAGSVKIEQHSGSTNNSYTAADAVQFKFLGSLNTAKVDQTNELLDVIYRINSNNSTPLRQTLQKIGQYYDMDDGNTGSIGNSPFLPTIQGGACQQAYTVAMTDGYWNDSGLSPSLGNVDQSQGAPYADSCSDTLSDVAMYYYNKDLASSLMNEMSTNNYDKMKSQHMVTFSMSFGLVGKIDRNDINKDGVVDNPGYATDPYFLNLNTPRPTWPTSQALIANAPETIDDLWHASVNGHGRFFVANDPDSMVKALTETFSDISSRKASGASVSVNGDELSSGLVLFQSSYESGVWKGDVAAYPIDAQTGEIKRKEQDVIWRAQNKVQHQNWDTQRNIVTFNGSNGIPFRYTNMLDAQKQALASNSNVVDYLRGKEVVGFRERERDYSDSVTSSLGDFVHSAPLLVSAVSPATDKIDNNGNGATDESGETGGTLFVGGNDGMLHAFNAETGVERFAYIPFHAFDYLYDLAKADYEHRYYVDGRQHFRRLSFLSGDQSSDGKDNDHDGCADKTNTGCPVGKLEISNGDDENYSDGVDNDGDGKTDEPYEYKTVSLLVGTLGKGGRGVYALDISNVEGINPLLGIDENKAAALVKWEYPPVGSNIKYSFAGDQSKDTIDNNGNGQIDEAAENYSDGFDNDGDGTTDEAGEMALTSTGGDDPDMGYTYGDAFIARSYKSRYEADPYDGTTYHAERNPWVVIFANGYLSKSGGAALYVVDALSGTLVRKIVADRSGSNGLSTPTIIDVDNDTRADFVYAGDLKGNMWKFDIRDPDPRNWGVFHGTDTYNDPLMKDTNNKNIKRIDYDDVNPSDSTKRDIPQPLINVGQPITTGSDVAFHPDRDQAGYLVAFGTGKFLGDVDIKDRSQRAMFGVWDFGVKPNDYLGTWSMSDNSLSCNGCSLPQASGKLTVNLLEQKEIDWRKTTYNKLRTLSNFKPQWYVSNLCYDGVDNDNDGIKDNESCIPEPKPAYAGDGKDNDGDGAIDEIGNTTTGEPKESDGHVGWVFKLPFNLGQDEIDNDGDGVVDDADEKATLAGERIIKDVMIRNGKVVFISMIPGDSPCSGGGSSIVHEVSLFNGGQVPAPVFDINNDNLINESDRIDLNGDGKIDAKDDPPPEGKMYDGILHTPVVVGDPDSQVSREMKIFSTSAGTTEVMWEKKEETGFYYWKEHVPQ